MVQHMAAVAERLREVRRARRQFLALWTLERLMTQRPIPPLRQRAGRRRDWSFLYRGSVLDD